MQTLLTEKKTIDQIQISRSEILDIAKQVIQKRHKVMEALKFK